MELYTDGLGKMEQVIVRGMMSDVEGNTDIFQQLLEEYLAKLSDKELEIFYQAYLRRNNI